VCNASPLGEIMKDTEIAEIYRKLELPTIRDDSGKIIPTEFSEKELSFIIFDMMHEMREDNRRKSGGAIEKNWNKMSKKERKKLEL
jgi:hypothetical protein